MPTFPPVAQPDPENLLDDNLEEPRFTVTQFVVLMIGVVIAFFVLDLAQDFFAPVLSALVLGIVLSPLSRLWEKLGLRASLAAFATLVIVLMGIGGLALLFEPYVTQAINRAPVIWAEFREAIEGVRQMLRGLDQISEDVAASVDPDNAGKGDKEAVDVPSLTDALFYAPQVVGQIMIFSGTLYFFLLVKTDVYAWIGASLSDVSDADFENAERQVAKYFLTITGINAFFGVLVGVVMHLFGLPAAPFWGMLAFLLNFILYLGPIAMAMTLLVTGLVVFDGAISVAPAAAYMLMNATEGQFITPAFVGHQMSVNPLLVFLSLVFWLWLWGPIGGIIAIPMMIWVISMTEAVLGQTISSGIPGKLRPNLRAARDE